MKTKWQKAEYIGHDDLVVDEQGVIYEGGSNEKILFPATVVWRHDADGHLIYGDEPSILAESELLPGHILSPQSPYRCALCGTDMLYVFRSNDYETTARCPDCGIEEVIHSG